MPRTVHELLYLCTTFRKHDFLIVDDGNDDSDDKMRRTIFQNVFSILDRTSLDGRECASRLKIYNR